MSWLRGKEEDWGDIPAALGMTVNERGALVGRWNGRVEIRGLHTWEYVQRTNKATDGYNRYYTELYAILDPPLHMGLRVESRGGLAKVLGDLFGTADIRIGHAEFDESFDVRGLDPEHVRRLLVGPVGEVLLRTKGWHPRVWISDQYATVEYPEYERDPHRVRAALETAGRLGEAVLAVRERELAAWERPLRAGWQAVADGWRLSFDPRRAVIAGEARGLRIEAAVVLAEGRLATEVRFTLSSPPACGLSLAPQNGDGFLVRLFRGQDIVVGDPAFDAAFVVKGEPEDQVRALLTPAARKRLLAARSRTGALQLDGGVLRLCVPDVLVSPDHLDDLLKTGFEAAEALCPGSSSHGPYRR